LDHRGWRNEISPPQRIPYWEDATIFRRMEIKKDLGDGWKLSVFREA